LECHSFISVDFYEEVSLFLILFLVLFIKSQITRFFLIVMNFILGIIQYIDWCCLGTVHWSIYGSIRRDTDWMSSLFLYLRWLNCLGVGFVDLGLQFNLSSDVILVQMFKSVLCWLIILIIILMVIWRVRNTFSFRLIALRDY
jgi:hypothetical protein